MSLGLNARLLSWWKDDPLRPGRPTLDDSDVQRLIRAINPKSGATDLGGVMSLNARLEPGSLVLRVHQPFITRTRLFAVQDVRRRLAGKGLLVPVALPLRGTTALRCGQRWAELEAYVPHRRPRPTLPAYAWMFGALGRLHRVLARLPHEVPRPVVATYAPPSTIRRWLSETEVATRHDPLAAETLLRIHDLAKRLRDRWVPGTALPKQLIHGDARLGNFARTQRAETLYLDFGFLAFRPRIHDLAYSLAYMVLALGGHRAPQNFQWTLVPRMTRAYEAGSGWQVTRKERLALAVYAAAVPLYHAAIAGFSNDPVRQLRSAAPFLSLSEWLLEHPAVLFD